MAKALELPWPANLAAVAAVAAQGFAFVAISIQACAEVRRRRFRFTVPGGTSLSDNMVIPMALSSGEQVD